MKNLPLDPGRFVRTIGLAPLRSHVARQAQTENLCDGTGWALRASCAHNGNATCPLCEVPVTASFSGRAGRQIARLDPHQRSRR